mgnify:CR=1 FL=1
MMVDTGRDLLRCAAERAGADGDHDTDDPDANGRLPFDPDTGDNAGGDVLGPADRLVVLAEGTVAVDDVPDAAVDALADLPVRRPDRC